MLGNIANRLAEANTPDDLIIAAIDKTGFNDLGPLLPQSGHVQAKFAAEDYAPLSDKTLSELTELIKSATKGQSGERPHLLFVIDGFDYLGAETADMIVHAAEAHTNVSMAVAILDPVHDLGHPDGTIQMLGIDGPGEFRCDNVFGKAFYQPQHASTDQ